MRLFSGFGGSLLVLSVVGFALSAACSGDGNPEVHHGSGGQGGSGGSAGSGGSDDGGPTDGSPTDGGDALVSDAPLAPVRVGIIPVAKPGDAGTTAGDEAQAELEVLAAGSRGVSVIRRWDQLYANGTQPVAGAWSALSSTSTLFHGSGRGLMLCLSLVDHTLDARPSGVDGAWGGAVTRVALDGVIDQVFTTFGDELVALSFGNELDRWFSVASAADRSDMLGLLSHAVSYARTHPSRPPSTLIGVTLGLDAITQGKPAEVPLLAALGDAVVATYYPLDSDFHVRPASTAAADLDLLVSTLASDAGEGGSPKPVLLQEVGYPSASESQSSPDQQRTFFAGLFQTLATRRDHFPFVAVNGLYDASQDSCAAAATALGTTSANAPPALCSLGLRQADGTTKPAYDSVLAGLATFASP